MKLVPVPQAQGEGMAEAKVLVAEQVWILDPDLTTAEPALGTQIQVQVVAVREQRARTRPADLLVQAATE